MSALKQWIERRRSESQSPNFGPLGVYLTQQHLHVVQLRRCQSGEIEFQSHASLTYPGSRTQLLATPAAIRKLIRRAMRDGEFRGRKVISAMPPEQVRIMSVSYPSNTAGHDAGAIAKLMADRVDGPLSDYVIDYVPIRSSSRDGDRLALVAVSSIRQVNSYLDSLAAAGLSVDFLEVGPLAIKRLVEFRSTVDQVNNVIVVSVGDTSSHVTTMSGRRLLADQEIQFCEATVVETLSKSLDLDTELARHLLLTNGLDISNSNGRDGVVEARATTAMIVDIVKPAFMKLVREIERAFRFAESESHGDGTRKLFIVGGLASWPGVLGLLSSLASTDLEQLGRKHLPSLGSGASGNAMSDQLAADMSTAVGLALRGLSVDD